MSASTRYRSPVDGADKRNPNPPSPEGEAMDYRDRNMFMGNRTSDDRLASIDRNLQNIDARQRAE
jgi:hypothetical protein